MEIFKFLQGLVGFGNLCFAEIKSCPSTYPTYDLSKAEICNKNFWIGNDPRLDLFQKFIRFGGVKLPLLILIFFSC